MTKKNKQSEEHQHGYNSQEPKEKGLTVKDSIDINIKAIKYILIGISIALVLKYIIVIITK